jgi:hypothetical protein
LHICRYFDFTPPFWILKLKANLKKILANKTIGRLYKYFVVDLLEFFKNSTTEVRHLDLRRHFEFYQKMFFHDFSVF